MPSSGSNSTRTHMHADLLRGRLHFLYFLGQCGDRADISPIFSATAPTHSERTAKRQAQLAANSVHTCKKHRPGFYSFQDRQFCGTQVTGHRTRVTAQLASFFSSTYN